MRDGSRRSFFSRLKPRSLNPSPLVSRLSHLFLAFTVSCTLTAVLSGCRSAPPPPTPLDQLTEQQAHGHQVFAEHCALCHNDRTPDAKNGPSLLGLYKKPYLPSGAPANDDRVSATLLHGRNMMPPQPLDPNSPDFTDLLAYLHTL